MGTMMALEIKSKQDGGLDNCPYCMGHGEILCGSCLGRGAAAGGACNECGCSGAIMCINCKVTFVMSLPTLNCTIDHYDHVGVETRGVYTLLSPAVCPNLILTNLYSHGVGRWPVVTTDFTEQAYPEA
jgi:hypothetical protein